MKAYFQKLLLFCTAFFPKSFGNNYDSIYFHQIWKVENRNNMTLSAILELQHDAAIDILDHSKEATNFRVFPKRIDEVQDKLKQINLSYTVQVKNLGEHIKKMGESRTLTRELCIKGNCPNPFSNSYMQFYQMIRYLVGLRSSAVSVKPIGYSHGRKAIWMVHIKCKTSCPGKKVWIEGGIHAREWISPATTLHLIAKILENPYMTAGVQYYIVPVANPDGYIKTWTENRFWRKNNASIPNTNCAGVDLNRNWAYKWGVGASSNPCSETYKGSTTFSEPETVALKNKMSSVGQLSMVLSLHSYSQVLLYPWGWTWQEAPDTDAMKAMGNVFKNAAYAINKRTYEAEPSGASMYFASGTTDDWAKAILKVKYSFTLELRPKYAANIGFELPTNQIIPTVNEVFAGFRAMINKLKME